LEQSLEEASLARSAQRQAAALAKKEEKKEAPKKKSTLRDITLGTKVTIYFEWADLDASLRKVGPLGKGQWLGGNVINILKKNRKWVYTVEFDTPERCSKTYNADDIKLARDIKLPVTKIRYGVLYFIDVTPRRSYTVLALQVIVLDQYHSAIDWRVGLASPGTM
jgi:hypothetical protein